MISRLSYLDAESSDEDSPKKGTKKAVEIQQVSKPRVSYSENEFKILINYIKSMTTLRDLEPNDWNPSVISVIQEFIQYPEERILSIYYYGDNLVGSLHFPTVPVEELTYFVRTGDVTFSVANFSDSIVFGTSNSNVESTISRLMETMLAPSFFTITTWPDSVKADFCSILHEYLGHLTDLKYKMHGLTVMYLPIEGNKMHYKNALQDQELVKRLEKIVVQWTRQIRLALVDQQQSTNNELLTLDDEYDFWIYRYTNLCGLDYQLKNPVARHIAEILISVASTCISQFIALSMEIDNGIKEASSNIMYLELLKKPCSELNNCQTPDSILPHVTKILHLLCFIRLQSPYFKITKRITHLFVLLENEIIMSCCRFIDLKNILEERKSRLGIKILGRCIDLCENYKKIVNTYDTFFWKPQNLNIEFKFENIEIFVGRCNDLIEIFRSMIDFARLDENQKVPAPHFGGTKGAEHDKVCEKVEKLFLDYLEIVGSQYEKILDIQDASWQDDMFAFRNEMKDLEIIIENLMNVVFTNINNVREGIGNFYGLRMYMGRDCLKVLFNFPATKVWRLFLDMIHRTKQELLKTNTEYSDNSSSYSRRALNLYLKISRLELTGNLLKSTNWIEPCTITEEALHQYEVLNVSVREKIEGHFDEWINYVSDNLMNLLDRTLMQQSVNRMGLLESNLDINVINLFRETHYWRFLGFIMPVHVEIINDKAEVVKFVSERILMLVIRYNKIIKALSPVERGFFKYLLTDLEHKLKQGQTKLTWNSEFVERYVDKCCDQVAKLEEFLNTYHLCNSEIMKICEKICDMSLVKIKSNYTYKFSEFIDEIIQERDMIFQKMKNKYEEIVQYVLVVYEGFQGIVKESKMEWENYLDNLDKLIGETFKTLIKNSLSTLYDVFHGTGKIKPSPFLLIELVLAKKEIILVPSTNEIATIIGALSNKLLELFANLPKLTEKFRLHIIGRQRFIHDFQEDNSLRQLQTILNSELSFCFLQLQTYLKIWEPFRDIWDENKATSKLSVESINQDVTRYTEIANAVQIQETITSVHFLVINCNRLKTELIACCTLKVEKLANFDSLENEDLKSSKSNQSIDK